MYKTKEEIKMKFGKGHFLYDITIPANTACKPIVGGFGCEGLFHVMDLSWLDKRHIVYHDAYYYGITLDETQVVKI